MSDNTIHAYDTSTTQKITGTDLGADKRAIDTFDYATSNAPLGVPLNTDYIESSFSGNVQTVIYKSGGSGGIVLKTITINYVGCNLTAVIT